MKWMLFLLFIPFFGVSQNDLKLAVLQYKGGGDWYSNPTAVRNLSVFCNAELNTNLDPDYAMIEVGSEELFNYPMVHMTGHGNVVFDSQEAENLRSYLLGGGFLHIDDNYGMDPFVRPEMKKVFPDREFVEIPTEHAIFNSEILFPERSA